MFEGSVDTYLEHAGVKGMKWGVRNRTANSGSASGGQQGPQKPKMSNKKKAAIAVGATIAVGAAYYALSKNKKVSQLARNAKYDTVRKFRDSASVGQFRSDASKAAKPKLTNRNINLFGESFKGKDKYQVPKYQKYKLSKEAVAINAQNKIKRDTLLAKLASDNIARAEAKKRFGL
jgi:hypothetical protein